MNKKRELKEQLNAAYWDYMQAILNSKGLELSDASINQHNELVHAFHEFLESTLRKLDNIDHPIKRNLPIHSWIFNEKQ